MYHLFKMAIRCAYKIQIQMQAQVQVQFMMANTTQKIVDGLPFHSLRMRCFQSRSTHKLLFFCTMRLCVCVCDIITVIFEDHNH
jgi:hypothetical protein